MKRLAWRKLALLWKRWQLRQLHCQIEIAQRLLYEARSEYAALRSLEGEDLLWRFGSYTTEELAPFFRQQRRWERFVEDLFVRGEYARLTRARAVECAEEKSGSHNRRLSHRQDSKTSACPAARW